MSGTPAQRGLNTATRRYIAVWTALALTFGGTVAWVEPASEPWLVILGGALLVALAERVQLDFTFDDATGVYTLIEVALTAALLLLAPLPAVIVAVVGTAVAQLTRGSALPKTLFAVAQAGTGMSIAALVLYAFPVAGPQVAGRPVLGAVAAMIVYVTLNLWSMIGLLGRFEGARARAMIRRQTPLTAAMTVGQIATGVVLGGMWEANRWLVPFVVAPAAAVYLAGRGVTRTTELLNRVQAQRDQLTRIVDGASDGILLVDGAGAIEVWNPAMTTMTGLDQRAVIGQPAARVFADGVRTDERPVGNPPPRTQPASISTTRELVSMLHHTDGTVRAVQESHARLVDDDGRSTGVVIVVRDVTRQREVERLRDDFVSTISHELRSPLAPIRGYVQTLLRRGDSIPAQRQAHILGQVYERTQHLTDLVEDLLLVTQRDNEWSVHVELSPTDLAPVVHEAVERVSDHDDRPITVDIRHTPDAIADPRRVGQILDKLLDNACRYSPVGTPITVTLDADGGEVRISVADSGPGIPNDRYDAVFDRFYRLEDSLTMRSGGLGLGLYIARQWATAMHGTLDVEDPARLGTRRSGRRGATFMLRVPRAQGPIG